MEKKDLNLMDDLMQAIGETECWWEVQNTDPAIVQAKNILSQHLGWVQQIDKQGAENLDGAIWSLVNAYTNAAILYGIHIATVLHMASSIPSGLSGYILDRIGKKVGA